MTYKIKSSKQKLRKEFLVERKEHPKFSDKQVRQIVIDHYKKEAKKKHEAGTGTKKWLNSYYEQLDKWAENPFL